VSSSELCLLHTSYATAFLDVCITQAHGVAPDFRLTEDAVLADSGAYSFGMAYCDIPSVQGEPKHQYLCKSRLLTF
jgi:hypothetical protein